MTSEETRVPMILALSLALHCSVLLGLPVAMFFCCMDQGPLSSLVAFILIANRFSMLVCQVCAGFSVNISCEHVRLLPCRVVTWQDLGAGFPTTSS